MGSLKSAGGGIRTHEGLCHRVLSLALHGPFVERAALPLRPDSRPSKLNRGLGYPRSHLNPSLIYN